MMCIPLSDRASVTTFVICCMRQGLEERLRMPFQSRIRSSIGKYTYLGKDILTPLTLLILKYQFATASRLGMKVRSQDLNPDTSARPNQTLETHEFRTMTRDKLACLGTLYPEESVIEDHVRFSAVIAVERVSRIGKMSEPGLGIAWCGNIPAWMPPGLGKERVDSKEMNYVPFT
ncbi:hypothetical protein M752DRAFT_284556 [Aspergillus phoenicis ATCC 13157]|uniref:Uncharacterized protein n=1 Tax=Aspergillus phoenicis ATCC 13157 TaxID=1353007 RepID=A0A370PFW3_ASPPH|nr:hypothetical protein M752DRAFT_284556 [Aspergillus phoenicis ATCC 13157]